MSDPIDLCGTADVFTYLQKQASDTSQTSLMGDLITRASRSILNWTGREFAPGTTTSRAFWYQGNGWLNLAPYDIRTPGTVTIDTETTSPGTLTLNTHFYLEPLPSPFGVYERFRFVEGFDYWISTPRPRQVTINGDWGFASVPDDVKQAAVVTVSMWMRRDVQAFSTSFNITEDRVERPEALPSAVRQSLAHYRRFGVA